MTPKQCFWASALAIRLYMHCYIFQGAWYIFPVPLGYGRPESQCEKPEIVNFRHKSHMAVRQHGYDVQHTTLCATPPHMVHVHGEE